MRKHLKRKRHSCALCKPHKMGKTNRWKDKELDGMRRSDMEMRVAIGLNDWENEEDEEDEEDPGIPI